MVLSRCSLPSDEAFVYTAQHCVLLIRNRRLVKDYERKVQTSETLIELVAIRGWSSMRLDHEWQQPSAEGRLRRVPPTSVSPLPTERRLQDHQGIGRYPFGVIN
jgi:hypothetical protein